MGEIAEALSVLNNQAEANQAMWSNAEQAIQGLVSKTSNEQAVANILFNKTTQTAQAFQAAETALQAEASNAQQALGLAENLLQAEAVWFSTAGCQGET